MMILLLNNPLEPYKAILKKIVSEGFLTSFNFSRGSC